MAKVTLGADEAPYWGVSGTMRARAIMRLVFLLGAIAGAACAENGADGAVASAVRVEDSEQSEIDELWQRVSALRVAVVEVESDRRSRRQNSDEECVRKCVRAKVGVEDYLYVLVQRTPMFQDSEHIREFKARIEPEYLELVVRMSKCGIR